jgi:hypothetical protein
MSEERWDNDRANRLLDGALAVLEAAGGWETPGDADYGDLATMLRFTELYFSEGVRQRFWLHVDLMNQGIETGNPWRPAPQGLGALARCVVRQGEGQES